MLLHSVLQDQMKVISNVAISKKYCVCVCFCIKVSGMQNVCAFYIVICGLSGCANFSAVSHKWHDFLKKKLLNIKCGYFFNFYLFIYFISLQLLWQHFSF